MWDFLGIPFYSRPTSSNTFQYLKNKYLRKHRPNRLPHDAFTSPRDSSSMQFFPRPSSALLWSSCCCPGTYSLSCSRSCCSSGNIQPELWQRTLKNYQQMAFDIHPGFKMLSQNNLFRNLRKMMSDFHFGTEDMVIVWKWSFVWCLCSCPPKYE